MRSRGHRSAWLRVTIPTTLTTLAVGMVRVVSPVSAGCLNDELAGATTVGTMQPGTAMTVKEMGRRLMTCILSVKSAALFEGGKAAYARHDYATTIRLWHSSADQGSAAAQLGLGFMYNNGQGVQQDDTEAVAWYRKAATQGDALAQYNLGVMYAQGTGVPQNYTNAAEWYRKAAEQGHTTAQYNLGVMYDNGQGVPQDDTESVTWYRRAAGQGLFGAKAQFNLGFMYAHGRGVPQDFDEAKRWTEKAADQKLPDAMLFMWAIKSDPERWRGTWPKNGVHHHLVLNRPYYSTRLPLTLIVLAKILEWRASKHRSAMFKVGMGTFDHGDYATAVQIWRPLAKQGLAPAQAALGQMYHRGQGVEQNYAEAASWFREAASQDFPHAQALLGVAYQQGLGVQQDDKLAVWWFRMAAEQGHALAQSILGRCYERGDGVPKDFVQAYKWLSLSVAHLAESAKNIRDENAKVRDLVAVRMTPAQITEAQQLTRKWKRQWRYWPR